jgi:drug/metabolite transporter (DMT)-like permease
MSPHHKADANTPVSSGAPAPGSPTGPATSAPPARDGVRGGAVWLALATVYLVWGSTYLAIRVCVRTLPPFGSAAVRFGGAALVLAVLLVWRNGRAALRMSGRQALSAALVGALLLAGGNGLVVLAETPSFGLPSGIAALLVALVPLLVVAMRAVTGDRVPAATLTGVLVGFAGLAILVAPRGGAGPVPLVPALVVVVAAVSWSLGSFLSGRLPMPADPFAATAVEMAAGAAVLAVVGLGTGERVDLGRVGTSSWVALAYLLVVGSLVAFTAYVWLLHHAPISLVATYAYVNPAVAVLLGALLLAEPVTPGILAGGLVIILGVAVVVSTERRARR